MLKISNHRLFDNETQVPYDLTPNRGGKFSKTPEGIVLHDTAGRLDGTSSVNWLNNPKANASAHLVIYRDGSIHQLAPFNVITWHAGVSSFAGRKGVNNFSIGIEIVNPGRLTPLGNGNYQAWFKNKFSDKDFDIVEKSTPEHGYGGWMDYTEEQITSVIDICSVLKDKYDMEWVTTHWKISPGRKVDTNPLFPFDHLRSKVFGRSKNKIGFDVKILANANLRRWPSFNDNILKVIARDSTVEVIRSGHYENEGRSELWHLVEHEGENGWIHGVLLELID